MDFATKMLLIFLIGLLNLALIIGLITITEFNMYGMLKGQIFKFFIITMITGALNFKLIMR